MKRNQLVGLAAAVALTALGTAQSRSPQQTSAQSDVPAYNAAPPAKGHPLPPIMSGKQLTGPEFQHPAQVKAYQAAAKIPAVLHQLPCYCFCDRSLGHNSLHSCFESDHGAHCAVCMKEALYAYRETKRGKTVKQIRNGIIRGEFDQIDLEAASKD
jgi:hypothetical protein